MTVLLLNFSAPLQAWGASSRFNYRDTRREPTKSGIIGLLAAAQGRSRSADLADLAGLTVGVRIDQAGQILEDFQTEKDWRTGKAKALTWRYYLADARFLVAIEGEKDFLAGLSENIATPKYPLFLGRRSCPPASKLVIGLTDQSLDEALDNHPWLASNWYRRRQPKKLQLAISQDCPASETPDEFIRDLPVRFTQRARRHELRPVRHRFTWIDNPDGVGGNDHNDHDPFALIGGDS